MTQDTPQDIPNGPAWQAHDLLTEAELAHHWRMSQRTLQRWRAEGYGPAWIAVGGTIRYRLGDVRVFEDRMRRPRGRA